MRMALITHEPFCPPSGGGSAEALYLVRELSRRNHAVHVFCPKLAEPDRVAKQFGIALHEFTAWPMGRYTSLRNFKYLLYPFFLRRLVEARARRERFDLILSQHAISAVAAGQLKQRLQIPVVMNFLDYLTGFMETWPPYLAPPPLLKKLMRFELSIPGRYQADGVLTVSGTLADYFVGVGFPRERILPINFGFDAELFPFSESATPGRTGETPTIVMHGSLDHHHLGTIALESMKTVVSVKPEVIFKFVGHRTGAVEKFLRRVSGVIPQARIEITGFVPYAEVARHLANATVGMVPYEESKGTHCAFVAKIVEYLAVGLPVVSTPLQSARRYFGAEPMVRFSEFDGASFGRCLLSWFEESAEARRAEARAASDRVRAGLDWRVISQKAIDFVEKIHQAHA